MLYLRLIDALTETNSVLLRRLRRLRKCHYRRAVVMGHFVRRAAHTSVWALPGRRCLRSQVRVNPQPHIHISFLVAFLDKTSGSIHLPDLILLFLLWEGAPELKHLLGVFRTANKNNHAACSVSRQAHPKQSSTSSSRVGCVHVAVTAMRDRIPCAISPISAHLRP